MENKINLAELLIDCPQGMELYSPLCGDCKLYDVNNYMIRIETPNKDTLINLYHDGRYYSDGEIMLFPKGKTTWEGFVPPCRFKDGDIIYNRLQKRICIYHYREDEVSTISHCRYNEYHKTFEMLNDDICIVEQDYRLATEEEKQKLFDAIKAHGYHWNSKTKILEKLIEPKFKDGDVVVAEHCGSYQLFLLKHLTYSGNDGYCYFGWDFQDNVLFPKGEWKFDRLATEEEKEKLFKVIKDNGYMWNVENKTLEKLIEPKFKVGDRIKKKGENSTFTITDVNEAHYFCGKYVICDTCDNNWELVPNKFDINTLVPFESRVLVRDYDREPWRAAFWSCLINSEVGFNYDTTRGCYKQCIPYKGNEHLLSTTDDCDNFYKT